MKTYVTKSGDMWDFLSFKILGSCKYTDALINANREYINIFIFSAGIELKIPEIDNTTKVKLPAWRY